MEEFSENVLILVMRKELDVPLHAGHFDSSRDSMSVSTCSSNSGRRNIRRANEVCRSFIGLILRQYCRIDSGKSNLGNNVFRGF